MDNQLLQAEMAKILSVCKDSITGWENGRTIPANCQMNKIMMILGR
jgi:DNA-binding transcriptional regulator YiaG